MRETQNKFIIGGVVMCYLVGASGCGNPNSLIGGSKKEMRNLENDIRELCSLEYMKNTSDERIAEDLEILHDIVKDLSDSKNDDNTCFKNKTLLNNIKSIIDEISKKGGAIKDKVEEIYVVLGTENVPDKHKAESTTRVLVKINQMLNVKFNEYIRKKNLTLSSENVDSILLSLAKSFAYFYIILSKTSPNINLKTVYSRCGENEVVTNTYQYISEQIKQINFDKDYKIGWNIDFSCLTLKTGLPGDHLVSFVVKTIIEAKNYKEIIEKLHLNDSHIIGSPNPTKGIINEMKRSKVGKISSDEAKLYNKILESESTKVKTLAIYNTILKQVKLNLINRIKPYQQMICTNYPALLNNEKTGKYSKFCSIYSEGLKLLQNNNPSNSKGLEELSQSNNSSNNFLGIDNELWDKDYWNDEEDKTISEKINDDNKNFNMKILMKDPLCSSLLEFPFKKLEAFRALLLSKKDGKSPYKSEYILSKESGNKNENYVIHKDKEQFMKEALEKFKKTDKKKTDTSDTFFYKPLLNFYSTILEKNEENNKKIKANKMNVSTIAKSELNKNVDIFASLNK